MNKAGLEEECMLSVMIRRPRMGRLAAACLIGVCVAPVAAQTARPSIRPVPGDGARFLLGRYQTDRMDYSAREFFLSGIARSYRNTAPLRPDGRWQAEPDIAAGYRTRIVVRRPRDASRFNGTLIVEWLNASSGFGVDSGWILGAAEYTRRGYGYVGVSAQLVDVQGLRTLGPWRYRGLRHPGDAWSYDIFAQAVAAVVEAGADDVRPLGAATERIERVIAHGQSQSASRLWTYYNAIAPLNGLFDGFYIHSIGFPDRLSQSVGGGLRAKPVPLPAASPVAPDIETPLVSKIRTDLGMPVMVVLTEADLPLLGAARSLHGQPDSRTLRIWEIAGAAHVDRGLSFGLSPCLGPPISQPLHRFVFRAGIRALDRWLAEGQLPAIAPRLELVDPERNALVRDPVTGIAIGGIRLPAVAVPTGTHRGVRPTADTTREPTEVTEEGLAFFCRLAGSFDAWDRDDGWWDRGGRFDGSPFPEPRLRSRLRSRAAFRASRADAAVAAARRGFLLWEDVGEALTTGSH